MDQNTEHEKYVEESKKLLAEIPEEFHESVETMAWENGHAYGYHEVLNYLTDYIHSLKKPIEQFRLNVIESTKRMV